MYQALEKVSSLFPQIRIDIIDTVLSGTNELIQNREADIGLSGFQMPSGLNEEICTLEFFAVAHKDHPLHQFDRPLSYEDLKSYRQIITRDSSVEKRASENQRTAGKARSNAGRWGVYASFDLISQNLGFAWLPFLLVNDALEQGLLKRLPLTEGAFRSASFYLNYQDKDQVGPAAREFIGELRLLTLDMPTSC